MSKVTLSVPLAAEDEAERAASAALARFDLTQYQHLGREDLLLVQKIAGHGDIWGVWQTPEKWTTKIQPSMLAIDLAKRVRSHLPESVLEDTTHAPLLEEGVLQLTRLALLMRLTPTGGERKNKRLKPSTITGLVYQYWPRIIAKSIERKFEEPDSKGLLGCLTQNDIQEWRKTVKYRLELGRLDSLESRGQWHDMPSRQDIRRTTNPKGEKLNQKAYRQAREFPPIPDDWLSEIGPKVLWLVREMGPHLLYLLEGLATFLENMDWSGCMSTKFKRISAFVTDHMEKHPWVDLNGNHLVPPFDLTTNSGLGAKLPNRQKEINRQEWPPRNWDQVKHLSSTLQTAHLFIALLITAARISEANNLEWDCVSKNRNSEDYLNGWTYKLSDAFLGDKRQWPAPPLLIQALGRQARLSEAWSRLPPTGIENGPPSSPGSNRALWLSIGASGKANAQKRLAQVGQVLREFALRLGMNPKPGGKNLHPHRFRKTIARLVGIALFNSPTMTAPLVLKRLLGHKSIEMTLHYILCDENIQEEAGKVLQELRIMNSAEALEEIHEALATGAPLPGNGGPAASRMIEAVKSHEQRLAESGRVWKEGSAYDLASILTMKGVGWRFIRKDVVCTKIPGEGAPCQKKRSRGEPNVSNCQPTCDNRLVLHRARRDVEELAVMCLNAAREALKNEQYMVLDAVVRQLLMEVMAFPDLEARYVNDTEVQQMISLCEEPAR